LVLNPNQGCCQKRNWKRGKKMSKEERRGAEQEKLANILEKAL
jgi:hypothetical protein